MFLRALEYALIFIALLILITQIVIPLIGSSPLFPFFKKRAKVLDEINDVHEDIEVEGLIQELEANRDLLRARRAKTLGPTIPVEPAPVTVDPVAAVVPADQK